MIERLFEAGVDVFRINMSHSPFDLVKKVHAAVRAAEAHFERPIGILCDLQGPKFRVGNIGGERVALAEGATFRFDTTESDGGPDRVFLPHPQIFEAVEPGHTLLLDDGKIRMTVVDKKRSSHRRQGAGGRHPRQPQGHQPARHRAADRAADREGQEGPRLRAAARRRLGGAVVRAARRGREAGPPADRPGGRR